jgi:geranylgeranyl reductase family protein
MKKYDVVVVGSGPSGATAARSCAKYGFSTFMIDKDKFPRNKPCGGAISSRALKQLGFSIDEVIRQVYYDARIYRPKGDFFTLESTSPLAFGVLRSDFDLLLVQKAISEGAVFKEEERAKTVSVSSSGVRVKCKSGLEVIGETLVAADGVTNTIAGQIDIRKRWEPEEVGLACVWEFAIEKNILKRLMIDSLEFYIGITPAGYGWIFPKGDYLSVGVGSFLKKMQSSRGMILNLVKKVSKLRNLKMSNPRWHLIPIGGFSRKISQGRILLVGDAAGFVDPLLGEGIFYAISSGKMGALAIKTALEEEKLEKLPMLYDRLCRQNIMVDLSSAYRLATKVYYYPNVTLGFFVSDDRLRRLLAEVIKGEKNYMDFIRHSFGSLPISIGKRLASKWTRNFRRTDRNEIENYGSKG